MRLEMVSVYTQGLIENLLHVHALANMARGASERDAEQYMKTAAEWMPRLERQFASLKEAALEPAPTAADPRQR